jgi:TATA element modulatory factor
LQQSSRDALLEEVSYLSSKLSECEDQLASYPALSAENVELREKTEALLILLGEKEEELESLLQDMKDVKHLYRGEIEKLMSQLVPVDDLPSYDDGSNSHNASIPQHSPPPPKM